MKPQERILNALQLKPTDTVPVLPLVGIHAAEIAGIKVADALKNEAEMTKAVMFALKTYGYDGVFPFMDLSAEAEAMGCVTRSQGEEIPAVVKPALSSLEDIKRTAVPEPEIAGRLPVFLRVVEMLSDQVGKEVAVCAYVTGPFTLAGHLLGLANLLLNCRKNPEALEGLFALSTETGITYGKALSRAGAQVIMILEPAVALISSSHFLRFVSAHLSKMVKDLGNRTSLVLHVCGNTTHLIEEMAKVGANGISIDAPVDVGFAKEKTLGRVCIWGNVSPVNVLLHGTREDVRRACEDCIQKAGKKGFVLSSGCEVPRKTPPENLKTMVEVARSYV
jgi:uroporphyrinogen decarboxylase